METGLPVSWPWNSVCVCVCVLGRGVILGYQGGLDVLLRVSEEKLEVG